MSPTEEWRPVPGFPDYQVSSLGRVASTRRGLWRVLRGTLSGSGYREFSLYDGGGRPRKAYAHRLVAEAFIGPCPKGQEVRHLDGDQANNRVGNLSYGTHSENEYDRVRHGTHPAAKKTHCIRGHAFSAENTYRSPRTGHRQCRACVRTRYAARAAMSEVAA